MGLQRKWNSRRDVKDEKKEITREHNNFIHSCYVLCVYVCVCAGALCLLYTSHTLEGNWIDDCESENWSPSSLSLEMVAHHFTHKWNIIASKGKKKKWKWRLGVTHEIKSKSAKISLSDDNLFLLLFCVCISYIFYFVLLSI